MYFTKGSATVTSNEKRFEVNAGEIAVINSNCLHDIIAKESLHFYCLIIDRSFCLANYFDTNLTVFKSCIKDTELTSIMKDIAYEYENPDSPFRAQAIRASVLKLLAILCRRYSSTEDKPRSDTRLLSSVKLAMGYISSEYKNDISLDTIAAKAGISKYYLAREFHRITGMTIVGYINLFRCEKAKQMLKENELSIESIAYACGFSNFSYFTKTFSKIEGIRPSQYRAASKK